MAVIKKINTGVGDPYDLAAKYDDQENIIVNTYATKSALSAEEQRAIAAEAALNAKVQAKTTAYTSTVSNFPSFDVPEAFRKEDGSSFSSRNEIYEYLGSRGICINSTEFAKKDSILTIDVGNAYMLVHSKSGSGSVNSSAFIIVKNFDTFFKTGDDIYLIEDNSFDRWFGGYSTRVDPLDPMTDIPIIYLYAYNAKADLGGYVQTNVRYANAALSGGAHTHTVSGTVNVPVVTSTATKLKATYNDGSAVTDKVFGSSSTITTTVTPATTNIKATASGTALNVSNTDSYVKSYPGAKKSLSTTSIGSATAGTPISVPNVTGNANITVPVVSSNSEITATNVASPTIKSASSVSLGTAKTASKVEIGTSTSKASKASAGTAKSFLTAAIKSASLATDNASTYKFNTNGIKSAGLQANDSTSTGALPYVSNVTLPTLSTKNYGFASAVNNVMYSPSVTNGVLSWNIVNAGSQDALSGGSKTSKYMTINTEAADSTGIKITTEAATAKDSITPYTFADVDIPTISAVDVSVPTISVSSVTGLVASSAATPAASNVTATNTVFGTNTTASKVTLGTALSIPNISVASKTVATGGLEDGDQILVGLGTAVTGKPVSGVSIKTQPSVELSTGAAAGTGVISVATGITSASTTITGDEVTALKSIGSPTITLSNGTSGDVDIVSSIDVGVTSAPINSDATAQSAGAHTHDVKVTG